MLEAIKEAIDDYAECEMGHREILLGPATQRRVQAHVKRALRRPTQVNAGKSSNLRACVAHT